MRDLKSSWERMQARFRAYAKAREEFGRELEACGHRAPAPLGRGVARAPVLRARVRGRERPARGRRQSDLRLLHRGRRGTAHRRRER